MQKMPERKPRFIPKAGASSVPADYSESPPYYGTGLSQGARLTSVGPVNSQMYGKSLKNFCQINKNDVAESAMRVKADQLTTELERVRQIDLAEFGYDDDTESVCSDTSSRWQCRETRIKYTGSLDKAKKDYFELEDIDDRSDMGPITDPINGYCYLCTTQEEHRAHLRSERKVRSSRLKRYNNPVSPESLPSKPFIDPTLDREDGVKDKARYKVVVMTGDQINCGTDAEVTLRMYDPSARRRSPKMVLKKPAAKFMFLRDSTNTFSLTAENFQEISAIDIETDGYEMTQSWFLESVNITNMKTGLSYYFPCSNWLSLYHEGETLVRRLMPEEHKELHREYEVTVVTGAHKHSGTDSKVYLTLVGSTGKRSKKCLLSTKGGHLFKRGAVDSFPLTVKDIGPLTKIRIEHDDKGKSRRWLLLIVHIRDLYNGRQHLFYCNQWLINEEGNAVWREIPAAKVPKGFDLGAWGGSKDEDGGEVLYEINVHTGDVGFAGTDANIRIQLYGENSQSKSINLSEMRGNYDDPFEKNQTDIFQVKAANVGELKKIKIGHDNKGVAAGWYLEKVLVRKFIDVRTRVAVESDQTDKSKEKVISKKNKRKEEKAGTSSDESSESEAEEETGQYMIGRNQTATRPSKSSKEKRKGSSKSTTDSVIHSVTRSQILDPAISDSDKVSDSDTLSDSDEDLVGSATDLQRKANLEKRKKEKQKKNRRRMDNLSDVAEISEASSANTSLWGSEEMPAMDKGIAAALRLKQEHDKLAKTMEKVVPKVEEYLFICKQWFAESEGDGKIERVLRVTEKKVYNRSDDESSEND